MEHNPYMTLIFTFRGKTSLFEHGVQALRMDGWTVWELTSGQVILQRLVHASTERDHYTDSARSFANNVFQGQRRLTVRYEKLAGQVTMPMNLRVVAQPDKVVVSNLVVFNLKGPFDAASIELQLPSSVPLRCDQVGKPNFTVNLDHVATRFWKSGQYSYKARSTKTEIEKFRQTINH